MAMRPSSRISRNWANPRPRVPSRWSAGTRHSTNVSPWVSDACQPILRYGGWTSNPGVPAGTTIVEISPGPVSAVTVTIDVIGVPELVMNDFSPSITHSPPTRRAGPGSGAAGVAAGVGFGQPEAAQRAPGAQVGQPALLLLGRAELVDRVGAEPDAGLQRDGQRLVGAGDLLDGHAQPGEVAAAAVRLGNGMPNSPSSPIFSTVSTGNVWSRSHASAYGSISASTNSRTTARSASCSSVSSGCMRPLVCLVAGLSGLLDRRHPCATAARRCRRGKAPT